MTDDDILSAVLTEDECDFINERSEAFPRIREGFLRYASIPTDRRLQAAMKGLKTEPRRGYVMRGIAAENAQSVATHQHNTVRIAYFLASEKNAALRAKVAVMMATHDLAEAVIGDFTPEEGLDKHYKHTLEKLAVEVLTAGPEHHFLKGRIRESFDEYEERESEASLIGKDADTLELVITARAYERAFPHLSERLQDFRNDVWRLRTEEGQAFARLPHDEAAKLCRLKLPQPPAARAG